MLTNFSFSRSHFFYCDKNLIYRYVVSIFKCECFVQYDMEIWMSFGCPHVFFTPHGFEKGKEINIFRGCSNGMKKSTWSCKNLSYVFTIWIFFAISSFARIEEMTSASLVLFMLIRTLWRVRRIPLLQTHKWMACVYVCTVIQSKKYS